MEGRHLVGVALIKHLLVPDRPGGIAIFAPVSVEADLCVAVLDGHSLGHMVGPGGISVDYHRARGEGFDIGLDAELLSG